MFIKKFLVSFLIVNISILFSLVLFEIFLRIIGFGFGAAPVISDNNLHHIHPKNYTYLSYHPTGEFGGHIIQYDNNGYRVNPDTLDDNLNQNKKIAFLGDSFTEALQVSWDKTFIGILEKKYPNLIFKNLGVSSFSPLIYLVQMKNIIKELNPSKIILQLYINDFKDDNFYLSRANSISIDKIKYVRGEKSSKIIPILRNFYIARLIRKSQLIIKYRLSGRYAGKGTENNYFYLPKDKKAFTFSILLEIKRLANLIDADLYLMFIPSKFYTKKNECCIKDKNNIEFVNFVKENRLNLIDLSKAFEKSINQKMIFFEKDIHLAEYGHRLVAKEISNSVVFN